MKKNVPGLVAGLALLVGAPGALAAPVTVDLRIEGAQRTLFEGPVTTDVRTFRYTDDPTEHRCDGTAGENQGTSPVPAPTRGAVIAEAAERAPFSTSGEFFASLGSPSFDQIAGENVAFDPATNRFLAEYKNGQFASSGSCADTVSSGDRVLFAYADGSEQLLELSGPTAARPGETATVKVVDGGDGAPVANAEVGGRSTAADGTAVVGPFSERGDQDLKATKPGAIRSNRLRVCVSDGTDGFCSSTRPGATPRVRDSAAPSTRIALRNGATYSRRRAPRLLRGSVSPDPSGVRVVKLRLTKRANGRCSYFSGRRERFAGTRCGRGSYFGIGDKANWSYQLPSRLPRGSYTLEAKAVDGAFNAGAAARVRFRVK